MSRLDGTIVRMIESELAGENVRARPDERLRTVGQPDADGRCNVQVTAVVAAY